MITGQPVTKQVAQSLYNPMTLTGYTEFFRQNSNREDGWADVRIDKETTWRKMWFIFDDGILKYGSGPHAPPSSFASIPMDNVLSLRADSSQGDATILITTNAHKFRLRLENQTEMQKWLFCFQKSVALVLSHLTEAAEKQSQAQKNNKYGETDSSGHRSPNNNPRSKLSVASPASKNPAHSHSFAEPGSPAGISSEDFSAAFRRNEAARMAGREPARRSSLNGSSAIPIGMPSNGQIAPNSGHHLHHHAHSHHSSHAASHGQQQAHSHHSHGRQRSTSGAERLSNTSIDRLATSFKEEDDENIRLEELLQTPSDGSRSRADSDDLNSNSSEEGETDWRSRGSNEAQDDEEDDLMFDLDETAEEARVFPVTSEKKPVAANNSNHAASSQHARSHSAESTGQDSFYSVGKALSLSITLSDPDHKSPSRRSSHSNLNISGLAQKSPSALSSKHSPKDGLAYAAHVGTSSSSSSSAQVQTCNSQYGSMIRTNHSDYLMWESGFCSNKGIRDSQEDRFTCLPNINDHLSSGGAAVPSSSGATSQTPTVAAVVPGASALSSVFASANTAQAAAAAAVITPLVSSCGLGGGVDSAGGYFGVYDGHGGQAAAIFLEKYLLGNICQHPQFHTDLPRAVSESCKRTDKDFLSECDAKKLYCGTTALGAFVLGSQLLVFSIGDCQAVLCTAGRSVELNDPHKPGREDESERIKKAGGWITEEKELFFGRMHRMDLSDPLVRDKAKQVTTWSTINRVCGEISVSRSIGDPEYKRFTPGQPVSAFYSWPAGHAQVFQADLLIPDPETRLHLLCEQDEFLILASDGLWDVVSPEEAVNMTRDAFVQNRSPSETAEELCELAIKLGSSDNVTVVITRFLHSL